MADVVPKFIPCPHCKMPGFDRLRTHSYCVECNYSPDFFQERAIPDWVLRAIRETSPRFMRNSGVSPSSPALALGAA